MTPHRSHTRHHTGWSCETHRHAHTRWHHTHGHRPSSHHRHAELTGHSAEIVQREAARSAYGSATGAVRREVAVAVGIAARGGDVRGVDDVVVHEVDFGADLGEEFRVAFFDVLAPEVGRFEEFGADFARGGGARGRRRRGHFAAVFGGVFLFDELVMIALVLLLRCGKGFNLLLRDPPRYPRPEAHLQVSAN